MGVGLRKRQKLDRSNRITGTGRIMRGQAVTYLAKRAGRKVLAASMLQGGKSFGRNYRDLSVIFADKSANAGLREVS